MMRRMNARRLSINTQHATQTATVGFALVMALTLAVTITWSALAHAEGAQLNLPRTQLRAGMHLINAQVAQTPRTREIGLMHRTSMPTNEGMLFVFERPDRLCFWMKNTLIPLSAAFIADNGRIVNIAKMQPNTTEPHCTQEPVRLVLEMNQGWFKQRGIGPGSVISGLR